MKTNTLDFDAKALREKILNLAIRGKLVKQDSNDEPAAVLLEKIKLEKQKLIKEKKIRKSKSLKAITSKEKPFDIPDSWEWIKFGEIVQFSLGKTPSRGMTEYWNNGTIPWVSIGDIKNEKYLKETKEKISGSALEDKFKNELVPANTLLMSFKLSIGLVKQDPNDEPASVLLEKIKAEKEQLIKEKKIKKSKPLPQISDDEKPFDIPDSWEWVRLGDVGEVKGGKRIPKGKKLKNSKSFIPYIRVADMENGSININNLKYATKDIYEKISNYTISINDVYFSIAGTIGKVGIIPQSLNGALLTENAAKLNFYQVNKNYIVDVLTSSLVKNKHEKVLSQVAQPKLSLLKLKQTVIPLPPLEEQSRIAAKITQLTRLLKNDSTK